MNQPVEQYVAVVDDGAAAAPEWCSYDAVVGWLRRAHGLSEGAALNQANEAIASGNVQRRGRWRDQLRKQFGQDFVPISQPAFGNMFLEITLLSEIELNFADFCAQIQRKIGEPRRRVAKDKARPSQVCVNEELLKFAKARGQKVKESDDEARKMLAELGATTRQIRKAFQSLPEEYRHSRARPSKSST